jgi:hypothetical protein
MCFPVENSGHRETECAKLLASREADAMTILIVGFWLVLLAGIVGGEARKPRNRYQKYTEKKNMRISLTTIAILIITCCSASAEPHMKFECLKGDQLNVKWIIDVTSDHLVMLQTVFPTGINNTGPYHAEVKSASVSWTVHTQAGKAWSSATWTLYRLPSTLSIKITYSDNDPWSQESIPCKQLRS